MSDLADVARALASRPGIEASNVIVAECVDSTNTLARRLLEEAWTGPGPCPEVVIVALEQTAGRGRQGRSWVSRRGLGVYVTLLAAVDEAELQTLPLLVGVGLARALRRLGCPVRLKWPNDLQVDGRKLGGILIESISREASTAAAIIGFGVNHGHLRRELPTPIAISLREVLDPLPPLPELIADLVEAVAVERAHAGDADYARQAYEELTVHRPGQTLRCRVAHEDLEGVFLGFDERGFLRLAVDGGERRVASGEIVE
ncbi:MAG TPA: biotin--[acetyl-CoA-carboxylase] ligase [Thermoanaerobaculia bacterium]|nr:biotin--[acetyl-CoA-carboxylase] ligase [Thermoanaerobaculia bacterium]